MLYGRLILYLLATAVALGYDTMTHAVEIGERQRYRRVHSLSRQSDLESINKNFDLVTRNLVVESSFNEEVSSDSLTGIFTFEKPQLDTRYGVFATVSRDAFFTILKKDTTGFTMQFSSAGVNSPTKVDWIIVR